jgi:hypothetical protein
MNQYRRFSALCHLAPQLRLLALACTVWLATRSAPSSEIKRPADAIEVFHCAFDEAWDADYDEWPDRWMRKSGEKYPHYVDIHMRETDDPQATVIEFGRTRQNLEAIFLQIVEGGTTPS